MASWGTRCETRIPGKREAAYLSGARLARHSRQIVHNVVNKDRDHALMVELFKKAAEAFDAADDASAVDVRKRTRVGRRHGCPEMMATNCNGSATRQHCVRAKLRSRRRSATLLNVGATSDLRSTLPHVVASQLTRE